MSYCKHNDYFGWAIWRERIEKKWQRLCSPNVIAYLVVVVFLFCCKRNFPFAWDSHVIIIATSLSNNNNNNWFYYLLRYTVWPKHLESFSIIRLLFFSFVSHRDMRSSHHHMMSALYPFDWKIMHNKSKTHNDISITQIDQDYKVNWWWYSN